MKLTASYVMIYIEIEKKPISLHLRSDFIIREYDYDIESELIMTVITYIIYAFHSKMLDPFLLYEIITWTSTGSSPTPPTS